MRKFRRCQRDYNQSFLMCQTFRSVPSPYLHALECFVAAKEEFVAEGKQGLSKSFSTLYDYQRKYVNGLTKQIPPGSSSFSTSRSAPINAPKVFPGHPSRQGPFFLQPAPIELKESPGAYATDIAYVTLGNAFAGADEQEDADATALSNERLGVMLTSFQDGKVDVYLDLEKVEARWNTTVSRIVTLMVSPASNMDYCQTTVAARPAITTYETIDLGIISQVLSSSKSPGSCLPELIERNHVTFYPDPIHDDTIYVYHAFGVHVINLNAVFQSMASTMEEENEKKHRDGVSDSAYSTVRALFSTYSTERL